jgi:XTP/dITP diphosphohydrolase
MPQLVAPLDRILFASGNRGKYREVVGLFARTPVEVVFGPDLARLDVEETGESYAVNAWLKARAWSMATGMAALADDSGLEVRALGWAPGVRSARFATTDADRIRWILEMMSGEPDRHARFVAAFALYMPSGLCVVTEGECRGDIAMSPSGGRGFGYDPVFRPWGFDMTFGELPEEVKRQISHRAEAGRRMIDVLFR